MKNIPSIAIGSALLAAACTPPEPQYDVYDRVVDGLSVTAEAVEGTCEEPSPTPMIVLQHTKSVVRADIGDTVMALCSTAYPRVPVIGENGATGEYKNGNLQVIAYNESANESGFMDNLDGVYYYGTNSIEVGLPVESGVSNIACNDGQGNITVTFNVFEQHQMIGVAGGYKDTVCTRESLAAADVLEMIPNDEYGHGRFYDYYGVEEGDLQTAPDVKVVAGFDTLYQKTYKDAVAVCLENIKNAAQTTFCQAGEE